MRFPPTIPKTFSPQDAEDIAEAYFLCEQELPRMYEMLNGEKGTLSLAYLTHILVRRAIVARVRQMRRDLVYTREEHIKKLQQIRDGALADENWKVGLGAEIAVGKAAGLYENIGTDQDAVGGPAAKPVEELSSEQIRARLSQLRQPQLQAPLEEMRPAGSRIVDNEPAF